MLAVAYSTGKILLCDIENSAPVHNLHAGSKPTTLMWSAQSKSTSDRPEFFQDFSSQFLPNLPAFEKRYLARILSTAVGFVRNFQISYVNG